MRPASFALLASALAALSCSAESSAPCPGVPVATFQLQGSLVRAGDPSVAARDPVPSLPDCTPDPGNLAAPIRYPSLLAFDATLSADPAGTDAALCRSNGIVYPGTRTGASSYSVSAQADSAVLCDAACAATLRVVVAGDVALDAAGRPTGFQGILVEVLTASRGACDGCLPPAPGPDPLACAARYALAGTPR